LKNGSRRQWGAPASDLNWEETMYYLIDNDEDLRFNDISDVLDYCVKSEWYENETDDFDEYLDSDGTVDVCGYEFYPSEILKEMNNSAYQEMLQDWAADMANEQRSESEWELERVSAGDNLWICGYRVYAYDEEEDNEEGDENEEVDVTFDVLEERLEKQKQQEEAAKKEEEKTGSDFLSLFDVQVI
jgi:hypothetical protein